MGDALGKRRPARPHLAYGPGETGGHRQCKHQNAKRHYGRKLNDRLTIEGDRRENSFEKSHSRSDQSVKKFDQRRPDVGSKRLESEPNRQGQNRHGGNGSEHEAQQTLRRSVNVGALCFKT